MPIPHLARRAWSAPLWGHALALTFLLLALMPVVGTYWQWSADEGAVLAQAQHLADGNGWRFPVPFEAVDPEGEWFPIHLSEQAVDGQWVPYAKLPAYPLLLAGALRLGGISGVVLVGVLGTAVAATSAGVLARKLARGAARPALWAAGLGSPLLFYAYSVIGHSLGAAAVGVTAVGVMRWVQGRRIALLAVVIGTAAAVALRNEALLMVAAGVLVLVGWALWRRDARAGGAAAVIALTAVVVFFANRYGYRQIVGVGGGVRAPSLAEADGFLEGRWDGFVQTVIRPSDHALLALGTVLLACAALLARRRTPAALLVRAAAIGAVLLAVVSALFEPVGLVPGLLIVTPVVVAGLLSLKSRDLRGAGGILLLASAVFAMGVLITQYRAGGTGEWGGRYFAIGLPLVVPVAVAALVVPVEAPRRDARRSLQWSVVAMSAVIGVLSVVTVRYQHDLTRDVVTSLTTAADRTESGDGGPPVVIATLPAVARLAWRDLPSGRWLLVQEGAEGGAGLDEAFVRLADVGIDEVTVGIPPGREVPAPDGWRLESSEEVRGGYVAATYRRERG
jgi:hypothetical protein